MSFSSNSLFIRKFFSEIYIILRKTNKDIIKVWSKKEDINTLKKLEKIELYEFLSYFDFITIENNNYSSKYLVIDKIKFIFESLKYLNLDIKEISDIKPQPGTCVLLSRLCSCPSGANHEERITTGPGNRRLRV